MIPLGGDIAGIALQAGFAVAVMDLIQFAVFDGPHEDIAQACGDRPHLGIHAFRKVFLCGSQAFRDLRPRKVDIGLFTENCCDLGKAIAA